jgi:hypothetical protein
MIVVKKKLDRRTVLRSVGVSLALPFLDAMVPAFCTNAMAAPRVRRLGVVYVPNGIVMEHWTPATSGPVLELPRILAPLAPFRDQLSVFSGFSHHTAYPLPGEGSGDHARGSASFLSGVHPRKTQGFDLRAGTTMDQLAARVLGADTQLASLEMGLDTPVIGSCDFDYSCTYVNTISWRTPTTPLPMETNPRLVFERLFGEGGSTTDFAARSMRLKQQRSTLDSIRGDVSRLASRLGARDRAKLDEYVGAVREVERGIQKAEAQEPTELSDFKRPTGIPVSYAEHARLMFDLQLLAYQSDVTRVTTLMMGRETTARSYPEIGVPDAHHPLSHHQGDAAKNEKLTKINLFHMTIFAEFVEKLKRTSDGDGTLFDNLILLYGAGMSDGDAHSHDNLPVLLLGGGSGSLRGNQHLSYPAQTPLANLLLTVLVKLGVPEETLGDSTGRISQLDV